MILAAGSLTTMTGAVVAPVLPDVVEQLNVDPAMAGLLVSMHTLTIAIFSPVLGFAADKTSPFKVLIPSMVLYVISGVMGAFVPGFWPLLLTRACLGAASGGIMAACLGWLGKNYEGAERARVIGFASGVLTVSGIIYPLLGGWIGTMRWQYAFCLYALGLPIAMWAIYQQKTQKRQQQNQRQPKRKSASVIQLDEVGQLLQERAVLGVLSCLALASMVMFAVVIYGPLYLKDTYGVTAQLNGLILAARALGGAITAAFVAKHLMRQIGHRWTTALGFSTMTLTLISIPWLPQYQLILTAAVIFGAGFGLVMPTLYDRLASLTPERMRSTVLAIGTGSGFLGQFIAPIVLSPIVRWSTLSHVFYGAAAIALLAGLSSLRLQSRVNT